MGPFASGKIRIRTQK
jgi:large subunit ribosomal protein L31